jgi:hypothetical protein
VRVVDEVSGAAFEQESSADQTAAYDCAGVYLETAF